MNPQEIKQVSNTQRALSELRRMIFDGDLPAGSDHLESALADRLGMSRTPVREAALTLNGQGLVALRPRKGVHILPVSPDDMREIYDVLTELESLAARAAADRKPGDTELAPLANSMRDMQDALDRCALKDWALADDRFHTELVRLGGNSRVLTIFEMMNDQVRRARAMTLFMRPLPVQSNNDHRDILNAIRAGNGDKAAAVHRAHRQNAKEMIVRLLETHKRNHI
jgi:DNA-binding GntR family transcriptional regulator